MIALEHQPLNTPTFPLRATAFKEPVCPFFKQFSLTILNFLLVRPECLSSHRPCDSCFHIHQPCFRFSAYTCMLEHLQLMFYWSLSECQALATWHFSRDFFLFLKGQLVRGEASGHRARFQLRGAGRLHPSRRAGSAPANVPLGAHANASRRKDRSNSSQVTTARRRGRPQSAATSAAASLPQQPTAAGTSPSSVQAPSRLPALLLAESPSLLALVGRPLFGRQDSGSGGWQLLRAEETGGGKHASKVWGAARDGRAVQRNHAPMC